MALTAMAPAHLLPPVADVLVDILVPLHNAPHGRMDERPVAVREPDAGEKDERAEKGGRVHR